MDRLAGQSVVVTGGASGVGEATVRLFVDEGASVIIADIQDQRGQRLADELGARARFVYTNVTEEAEVKAAIQLALDAFGRLDCVFNNAGGPGAGGPIEAISAEGFDATIDLLLRSVFFGMKHAAPILKAQGSGSIISTASITGLVTGYGGHIYSAAKAAVIHLTRSVAMELREFGVRVNCICPGFIATPIFGRVFGVPPEEDDHVVAALQGGTALLGQPGKPEDIAHAALWLASDESRFVNGLALVVDNGVTGGFTYPQLQSWVRQVGSAIGSGG